MGGCGHVERVGVIRCPDIWGPRNMVTVVTATPSSDQSEGKHVAEQIAPGNIVNKSYYLRYDFISLITYN